MVGVDSQFLVYRVTVDSVDPYTWQTASRGDVIIQLWRFTNIHIEVDLLYSEKDMQ